MRLGQAERERRLQATLAQLVEEDEAWVFAYGSLMWNPAFAPVAQETVRVPDHRRRFCFWTCRSRGTVERPGLGLGLEPGARGCVGLAQRLHPDRLEAQLRALWNREMGSGIYRARWLAAATQSGGERRLLAFVVDPQHPQFLPAMDAAAMAWVIARARGVRGPCRDYLASVVAQARRLGAPERELEDLLRAVDTERASASCAAG